MVISAVRSIKLVKPLLKKASDIYYRFDTSCEQNANCEIKAGGEVRRTRAGKTWGLRQRYQQVQYMYVRRPLFYAIRK